MQEPTPITAGSARNNTKKGEGRKEKSEKMEECQRMKVRVVCLDRDEIERELLLFGEYLAAGSTPGAISMWRLKGNGVVWCGVNGIIVGVQEMERVREGVAILLNDVWHSALIYFGCVSSRILWIKFKFSRVKVCVVVGYSPSEGDGEKRDRFWIE